MKNQGRDTVMPLWAHRVSILDMGERLIHLAVDLSSAVVGGGITYATELLPALREHPGVELRCALVRDDVRTVMAEALGRSVELVPARSRLGTASRRWSRALTRHSIDVVFVPTELFLLRTHRLPHVVAVRNGCYATGALFEYPLAYRAGFRCRTAWAKWCGNRAAAVIAVSEFARSMAIDRFAVGADKISVVYHGAGCTTPSLRSAVARPGTRDRPARLLYVSNFCRYKNVHRLIDGLSQLSDVSWDLSLVGPLPEPSYTDDLRRLVSTLGLTDSVHFRGHIHREHLGSVYDESDLFVWPSYIETFGHPLLEAYCHGLPIVAADAASNREVVGDAAIYFDPYSPASIRVAVLEALSASRRIGDLPRCYSWDATAEQTAKVLIDAAKQG